MSAGLSDEDARRVAAAFAEALRTDSGTAEKVQQSVVKILENTGANVLGRKIAETNFATWSGLWNSVKDFFGVIWDGVVGALDSFIDLICNLF